MKIPMSVTIASLRKDNGRFKERLQKASTLLLEQKQLIDDLFYVLNAEGDSPAPLDHCEGSTTAIGRGWLADENEIVMACGHCGFTFQYTSTEFGISGEEEKARAVSEWNKTIKELKKA